MAVLAECPICHRKQSNKHKLCACGMDLDKAKGSRKVNYWIAYRLRGKQKREFVGKSIKAARDADGKRSVQKRENRTFDIKPDARMSFAELTEWYLDLPKVKKLKSLNRTKIKLANFNRAYGDTIVANITPVDIEKYQDARETDGAAPATIDLELSGVQAMINKAFYDNRVSGDTLKVFKNVKKLVKGNENARKRVLSTDEYHPTV